MTFAGARKPRESPRRTSYAAINLPADSVGPAQIRKNAVGTDEIADGSVDQADPSTATRAAFTLGRAAVTKAGAAAGGNAKAVGAGTTPGTHTVTFDRDVSGCQYAATLAAVKSSATATDAPDPGTISTAPGATTTQVEIKTYAEDAATHALAPANQPFHLLVAC